MKIKSIIAFLSFILFTAFSPAGVIEKAEKGRDTVEERITKSFAAKDLTEISVTNFSGSIDIRPSQSDKITVTAIKRVKGNSKDYISEILSGMKVDMQTRGSSLEIISTAPSVQKRSFFRRRNFSRSVHFNIDVPARLAALIYNKYGPVSIKGIKSVDVENISGRLNISSIKENADLSCSYNPVEVFDIGGDLTVNNKSGSVQARRITGRVDIVATYNKVIVRDAKKDVFVDNKSGAVDIRTVTGDCDVKNSYNNVSVSKIEGRLSIDSKSASVTADNIGGDFIINTTYNKVDISNAGGGRITNKSGSVYADDIKGDLYIQSSYNPINADNIQGRCDIVSTSGSVTLHDIKSDVDVETSYNPVKITSVKGEVRVRNKSGSIFIKQIEKNAIINSSYNPVELYDIGGSVEIDCQNGRIFVSGAKDISASTTYNPIVLEDIAGSVDVITKSGKIEADLKFNPKARYSMETSYGDIRLTFTGEVSAKLNAMVPKGYEIEIDGDLELKTKTLSRQRLDGIFGKGEARVDLSTKSSGNIYIRSWKTGQDTK